MLKKPIFIWVIDQFGSPLHTLANYNNEIITAQGFDLRFWDIRGLNKNWYRTNRSFTYTDEDLNISMFHELSAIETAIQHLKKENHNVFFLLSGKIAFWNRPFIKLLELSKMTYGVRRNRASFYDETSGRSSSKDAITSKSKKIINDLYTTIIEGGIMKWGLQGPKYIFLGTKHDMASINYPIQRNSAVYTHTKDYDFYLTIGDIEESLKNQIVFIDQYLPYHAETKQLGIDADQFYKTITNFLQNLAHLLGTSFIVAAHPASSLTLMKQHIPEENLQCNKTLALIKHCKIAITINSSAALAALICKKPILLIKSNFFPVSINNITKGLADKIKSDVLDIEQDIKHENLELIFEEFESRRDDLFQEFIKHPKTLNKLEFEIICETFKNEIQR